MSDGASLQAASRSHGRLLTALLITDIIDSSHRVTRLGDRRWLRLLGAHDRIIRRHVATRGGRTIKHTGDGLIALFTSASDAVDCARAAARDVARLPLEIRCGVHAGEVSVRGDDVFGIAVHTAARVASASGPSEVLVSPIVRKLTRGAGPRLEDAGTHAFKGFGQWRLYRVTPQARPSPKRRSRAKQRRSHKQKGGDDE